MIAAEGDGAMKVVVILLLGTSVLGILNVLVFWVANDYLYELVLGVDTGMRVASVVSLIYEGAFMAFVWMAYTRLRDLDGTGE